MYKALFFQFFSVIIQYNVLRINCIINLDMQENSEEYKYRSVAFCVKTADLLKKSSAGTMGYDS